MKLELQPTAFSYIAGQTNGTRFALMARLPITDSEISKLLASNADLRQIGSAHIITKAQYKILIIHAQHRER